MMKRNVFEDFVDESELFSNLIGECPLCHCVLDPRVVSVYNADDINASNNICGLEERIVTYYCKKCKQFFHAIIRSTDNKDWYIDQIYPFNLQKVAFSDIINELSPCFIKCFTQAQEAEEYGLNEISGLGYRKSLEYLIKDLATKLTPEKENEIKSDNKLSNVIANRIPDKPEFVDIKNMAKSSWILGCDFVHYDKIYIEYDLNDLKSCIDLTVSAIEYFFKKTRYSSRILKK